MENIQESVESFNALMSILMDRIHISRKYLFIERALKNVGKGRKNCYGCL